MANRSPKLAVLAMILLEIEIKPDFAACRQLMIVCDWPMISFVVTLIFLVLGVGVRVYSGLSWERAAVKDY